MVEMKESKKCHIMNNTVYIAAILN